MRTPRKRRCHAEWLERREMLTTMLFLDFGQGIGFDATTGERNELIATVADLRDINGPGDTSDGTGAFGTGPDLDPVGYDSTDPLHFLPMNQDYDLDGDVDADDLADLSAAVIELVGWVVPPRAGSTRLPARPAGSPIARSPAGDG